jgi:hypothetical protein
MNTSCLPDYLSTFFGNLTWQTNTRRNHVKKTTLSPNIFFISKTTDMLNLYSTSSQKNVIFLYFITAPKKWHDMNTIHKMIQVGIEDRVCDHRRWGFCFLIMCNNSIQFNCWVGEEEYLANQTYKVVKKDLANKKRSICLDQ